LGIDIVRTANPDAREHISRNILTSLPDWFGIPEAIEDYARDCRVLPMWVAYDGGSSVGFVALKETSDAAVDMHVLGILLAYQRAGIGRRFCALAEEYARGAGKTLLSVMTLSDSHPDLFYARTRAFYRAMGFLPLMTLNVWGPENPCLIMVKPL
jgi:GNAT superfamily N-acetyltransferase